MKITNIKKLIMFNNILSVILLIVSVYLYDKLPEIVPIKIGIIGQVINWGNKTNIFLLPLVLLVLSFLCSREGIYNWYNLVLTNNFIKRLLAFFVVFIWICSLILYWNYFKLI